MAHDIIYSPKTVYLLRLSFLVRVAMCPYGTANGDKLRQHLFPLPTSILVTT